MNDDGGKHEDVLQLKQLVLHLQAELNRYKTNLPSPREDMESEQERLLEAYNGLLYTSKKQEKRIQLYEKRLSMLTSQRDEALLAAGQYKKENRSLKEMNDLLSESLEQLKLEIVPEIRDMLMINQSQQKLIAVLEEYVRQLTEQ